VLTLRKITVPIGDTARATRRARYLLDATEAPSAFASARSCKRRHAVSAGSGLRPSAVWLGTSSALAMLALERGREVARKDLAMALQGRSTETGEQVRRPGAIVCKRRDQEGRTVKDTTLGVASLDLTFSAPKSVSVIWSQADLALRLEIEAAMLTAANAVLGYMTQTKRVVMEGRNGSREKLYGPARGFAAAASLHVTARRARGRRFPSPQLHVHGVLLGAQRGDGTLAAIESSALFKHHAPLEGGAVGRAVLASRLIDIGFEIQSGTGKEGRFFEVRGIPSGLIVAMSERARDVQTEIERIESARGRAMGARERAVVALNTRSQKQMKLSSEQITRAWDSMAAEFGFGSSTVARLRRRPNRRRTLEERRDAVRRAIERRMRVQGEVASIGATRAIAFECATGQLGLGQAHNLLHEMGCADDGAQPTHIRAQEK